MNEVLSAALQKAQLRELFAARRKLLPSPEKDGALLRAFFASPYRNAERFFVYLSVGSEAPTRAVIEELLSRKKQVLVPRIANGKMLAVPYTDKLVCGKFGIPAPEEGEDCPCDVALVPLLAFDGEGYRLGYGGGYYDRYFEKHCGVLRVGFSYAGQAADLLPREKWDMPLHAVVTETGTMILKSQVFSQKIFVEIQKKMCG